ncbi:MAG: hypothetical protein ACOX6D_07230 [Thermoguttaceae bacterium]|jgi:hypothetical protein
MPEEKSLKSIIAKLSDWCQERRFAGYDPYDALNSPIAWLLSLGTRPGRIAITQFGRRSPINYRPILGIRQSVNPKAIGLFLEGYVKLDRLEPSIGTEKTMALLFGKLLELQSPNTSGAAWGYNFPWQNRFQLLPRWTPTIVNSSFIGHALLDYYEKRGIQEALDLALTIPDFFLNDLQRKSEGDTFCFSYTPKDVNFVHNANMLGASLLARIAVKYGRNDLLDPALSSLRYSMNHQREDGSWFYAETKAQRWIDSFHTGFNLESLRRFLKFGLVPEYREAYERGVEFYANNFFMPDGEPKYYCDRLYLVDIHAPAEAISLFAGEGEKYRELVDRIYHWTLDHMYDEKKGVFYFRKTRHFTIKTPYMRWSEAWAFRALTTLLSETVTTG